MANGETVYQMPGASASGIFTKKNLDFCRHLLYAIARFTRRFDRAFRPGCAKSEKPTKKLPRRKPAMGSIKKKRRAKMSKHKHDKRIKLERHKTR